MYANTFNGKNSKTSLGRIMITISDLNYQFLIHQPPSAGLNCLENDCTKNLVYFLSNMGEYMQELNTAWLTLHNSFYY